MNRFNPRDYRTSDILIVCTKCKQEKSSHHFPFDKSTKSGFYSACRSCQNGYKRASQKEDAKFVDRRRAVEDIELNRTHKDEFTLDY